MFDKNQLIKVKWNNTNKEWYQSKGYVYTKRNDEFVVKAKDLSPRSSAKIDVICDYCGDKYKTQYVVINDGRKHFAKDACSHCASKKVNEMIREKRANKYIDIARNICEECEYILLTTVDDYTDIKMDINFICKKHGKQTMMFDNFIRGHRCKDCAYEENGKKLRHDIQYVKECIESINGNKLLNPEDYKDTFTKNLNIRCSCGNIFTTSFSSYTKHGVDTCYSCSCKESVGEERIRKFLELNCIDFVQEKRFVDCKDSRPLPFDFYLPTYNLVIEFDGIHHFEETGRGNHEITAKHDAIKNNYCELNGIELLRIPYWEGNKIEEILIKQLNL